MNLDELKQLCGDGVGQVSLRIPRQSSNGYTIRLTPRSGPIGAVVCGSDDYVIARFDAKALLRWIEKQKSPERD